MITLSEDLRGLRGLSSFIIDDHPTTSFMQDRINQTDSRAAIEKQI